MFIKDAGFEVMNTFHIGDVRPQASVGECSLLRGGLGQVGKRIVTGIVVEAVMPHKSAQAEQRGRADLMSPAWRDIVSLDLRALVLQRGLRIKRIRRLEPGTGIGNIQVYEV